MRHPIYQAEGLIDIQRHGVNYDPECPTVLISVKDRLFVLDVVVGHLAHVVLLVYHPGKSGGCIILEEDFAVSYPRRTTRIHPEAKRLYRRIRRDPWALCEEGLMTAML